MVIVFIGIHLISNKLQFTLPPLNFWNLSNTLMMNTVRTASARLSLDQIPTLTLSVIVSNRFIAES
jgi:hypothetical protein